MHLENRNPTLIWYFLEKFVTFTLGINTTNSYSIMLPTKEISQPFPVEMIDYD